MVTEEKEHRRLPSGKASICWKELRVGVLDFEFVPTLPKRRVVPRLALMRLIHAWDH